MKSYFLFFALALFGISIPGNAELMLSKVALNAGKNPFYTSFNTELNFKGPNKILMVSVNNVRVNTRFGYSNKHANILATCGVQQNTPWLGPEADFSFWRFSTLHWFGWIFGRETEPKWQNPDFFFGLNAVYFSVTKNLTVSYTIFHMRKDRPNNMPGISFCKSINSNYYWLIGCDYGLRDNDPMFNMGLKFTP